MGNNENNPLVIEMTDDNGIKVQVEIVSRFEDGGKQYVVANDLSNDTDAYILELKSTEEGDMLVSIDDEEEFDRLCKLVDESDIQE